MDDTVRYATRDVYAEVQEEGAKINRLVAVAGQPVSPAFAEYVDDKDTTTDVPDGRAIEAYRQTTARKAAEPPQERSHEEMREVAQYRVGDTQAAGAPPDSTTADTSADKTPAKRARKSGANA